jgi:glucose dehydrogenase
VAVGVAWRHGVQVSAGPPEWSLATVIAFVRHVPSLAVFSAGRIGWLVTGPGLAVGAAWLVGVAAVGRWALLPSARRSATVLVAVGLWLATNLVLEAAVRPSGFGVQARYGLPLLSVGLLVASTVPAGGHPAPSSCWRRRHWSSSRLC